MQKKTRNSRGKSRPMETHLYPMRFFFSFTSFFLWTLRKIPCYFFFLRPVSISRIMNAKKNSKSDRELNSNGNTLLPHRFFFSFTNFFLRLRNIPCYFFLSPVIICSIMNANNNKKNSKFEKEAKSYENPILHHRIVFFFH